MGDRSSPVSPEIILRLVAEAATRRQDAEKHFREMVVTARAAGIPLKHISEVAALSTSRIHAILGEEQELMTSMTTTFQPPRPASSDDDVLIVPAGKIAWQDYLRHSAYICQPNRSFRDVDRIGFYRFGHIEPFFPRVRYRKMNVDLTRESAALLRSTGAALDSEIADVIDHVLDDPANGHTPGAHQIFLLTPKDDAETLRLPQPIEHRTLGRGTAWTQNQRYTSEALLRQNPQTTDDLRKRL
jgi:hypothetical protein